MGSSSAYTFAKNGKSVLLLEQFSFLHERGSSHGGSRIFRHAYEDARYVRMCVDADAAWQTLEAESQEGLLFRSGGLDIGRKEFLEQIAQSILSGGSDCDFLSPRETTKRFPVFKPQEENTVLYQESAGVLAASRAVTTLLRMAVNYGADLRDNEAMLSYRATASGVEVTSSKGNYQATKLIVCAGAWISKVFSELELKTYVEKQQVLYIKAKGKDFLVGKMPIFIERDHGIYGMPSFERPTAIKVGNHYIAPQTDPDTRDFELNQDIAKDTCDKLASFMNLTPEILDFSTCLYTKTPDEHFIMDRHPETPQILIAGGFSGHGFKFGPILGNILFDLAYDQDSTYDLSLFGLERLKA